VRRERTNTPLQALLLMNDPQFVECARAFAERTMREGGGDARSRAAWMFQEATCRPPDIEELEELVATYHDHQQHYQQHRDAAQALVDTGESKPAEGLDPVELAAWTMLGNLVLNLDEVVTKN
jgi:hypothetical protein